MIELQQGDRIYYAGDMANFESFGTVKKRTMDRWGNHVDITLDDGREMLGIPITAFSREYLGHCGTKFVTEKAYHAWRNDRIRKIQKINQ